VTNHTIRLQSGTVSARHYAAHAGVGEPIALILAHGAGAGHLHPFMVGFGTNLAARGIDVVTFNFPYKESRRKVPDRAAALEQAYLAVIADTRQRTPAAARSLFIGGKSMGGRMASHVAAHHAETAGPLSGLVFLGYPLHPPGRPDQLRDAHLPSISAPLLFVQGSRDAFGTPEELRPVLARLSAPAGLVVVEGGDHSFTVPRGSGRSRDEVLGEIYDRVARWMRDRAVDPRKSG
jgi:hypothetical protein